MSQNRQRNAQTFECKHACAWLTYYFMKYFFPSGLKKASLHHVHVMEPGACRLNRLNCRLKINSWAFCQCNKKALHWQVHVWAWWHIDENVHTDASIQGARGKSKATQSLSLVIWDQKSISETFVRAKKKKEKKKGCIRCMRQWWYTDEIFCPHLQTHQFKGYGVSPLLSLAITKISRLEICKLTFLRAKKKNSKGLH
jgi:hypothetical protein